MLGGRWAGGGTIGVYLLPIQILSGAVPGLAAPGELPPVCIPWYWSSLKFIIATPPSSVSWSISTTDFAAVLTDDAASGLTPTITPRTPPAPPAGLAMLMRTPALSRDARIALLTFATSGLSPKTHTSTVCPLIVAKTDRNRARCCSVITRSASRASNCNRASRSLSAFSFASAARADAVATCASADFARAFESAIWASNLFAVASADWARSVASAAPRCASTMRASDSLLLSSASRAAAASFSVLSWTEYTWPRTSNSPRAKRARNPKFVSTFAMSDVAASESHPGSDISTYPQLLLGVAAFILLAFRLGVRFGGRR